MEIRPITPDELGEFTLAAEAAFSVRPSDEDLERFRKLVEYDRTVAVFDDGQIVATADAFSFELTLPGLTRAPVAGVSAVGVLPTHRRRGLLREMMRLQLEDVRQRGEALAVLTASESLIYSRFGYGLATSQLRLEIERQHASLARPWDGPGRVWMVPSARELEVLEPLYERLRVRQVGALERSHARWAGLLTASAPEGYGPRFTAAYETSDGRVDGAVMYRVKANWEHGSAQNSLLVTALFAGTTAAYAALWHFVSGVDLVRTIALPGRPVDDPLRWMLADPRRLRVAALVDDLWLRIVDVPAALSARRYVTSGELVLDVTDPFLPDLAGRFRVAGGPDGATCEPTDAHADVELSVADLGALYLGGARFSTLARAGRVREMTQGALQRGDAMFQTDPAPWCGTPF
jgi:predicted acetyltransferase